MKVTTVPNTSVHFKSKRHDWETPDDLYNLLDKEFGFTLDVCANAYNWKHTRYFTLAMDGLARSWANHVCWMNPPYGRQINRWVAKALL